LSEPKFIEFIEFIELPMCVRHYPINAPSLPYLPIAYLRQAGQTSWGQWQFTAAIKYNQSYKELHGCGLKS
jgi:hypothetical protein